MLSQRVTNLDYNKRLDTPPPLMIRPEIRQFQRCSSRLLCAFMVKLCCPVWIHIGMGDDFIQSVAALHFSQLISGLFGYFFFVTLAVQVLKHLPRIQIFAIRSEDAICVSATVATLKAMILVLYIGDISGTCSLWKVYDKWLWVTFVHNLSPSFVVIYIWPARSVYIICVLLLPRNRGAEWWALESSTVSLCHALPQRWLSMMVTDMKCCQPTLSR